MIEAWVVPAAVLGFSTVQRVGELVLSTRNTKRLLARGAVERGGQHYFALVFLHVCWLVALWSLVWGRPVIWPWLAVYFAGQAMRLWVVLTLKDRWTTKIIVLPGAPRITTGPYRYLVHPNYLAVVVEVAALPLAFDLPALAAIFSALNALALTVRVREEDAALDEAAAASL